MAHSDQAGSAYAKPPAPFVLNVVWHLESSAGRGIAEHIGHHLGTDRYRNVVGGAGLPVLFRCVKEPTSGMPATVDRAAGDAVAAVVLIDQALAGDGDWIQYVQELAGTVEEQALGTDFPLNRGAAWGKG